MLFRSVSQSRYRASKIKKVIINRIDEELTGCGMWIIRSCHSNGSTSILESVGSFMFDRMMSFFIDHPWFESSTLNHKTLHNTMKESSTIKPFCYISEKVCNGIWRFCIIKLKSDRTKICVHSYCFHKTKKRNKFCVSISGLDFLENKKTSEGSFFYYFVPVEFISFMNLSQVASSFVS